MQEIEAVHDDAVDGEQSSIDCHSKGILDCRGIKVSGNVFKIGSDRQISSSLQNYQDVDILLDNRLKAEQNS